MRRKNEESSVLPIKISHAAGVTGDWISRNSGRYLRYGGFRKLNWGRQ
jgi:hypothetical protein